VTTIEQLPHSIECDDCDLKHFLTINRDIYGQWSAAYIAYADDGERVLLHVNNCETLKEVAIRLESRLKRFDD
jgi:hypothetical protein